MQTTPDQPSQTPSTMIEALRFAAARVPDHMAVLAPERPPMLYPDLLQQVENVVGTLNSFGLTTRSCVLLLIPDAPDLLSALLAVTAGFTAVVLSPDYRQEEIEHYIRLSHPEALLVFKDQPSLARDIVEMQGIRVIELVASPDRTAGKFEIEGGTTMTPTFSQREDVAVLLSTSGTTGLPKLIPFTHELAFGHAYDPPFWDMLVTTPGKPQTAINMLPLFHLFGFSSIIASLAYCSGILALPRFEADTFYRSLDEFHVLGLNALPVMLKSIVAAAPLYQEIVDRSELRLIYCSSAPLSAELAAEAERIFRCPLVITYGMTEIGGISWTHSGFKAFYKPGSVGQPIAETGIMDEEGRLLVAGQVGEIVVHNTALFRGYTGNPDAGSHFIQNGWFHTGDLGYLDEQNYLFITGRVKEIVNRGGEKVSPSEVEAVLLRHPAVRDVAVFGIPSASLGEDLAAAVVSSDSSLTPKQLRKFAGKYMSPQKIPSVVLLIPEIPRTHVGKVPRLALPQLLGLVNNAGHRIEGRTVFGSAPVAPRGEIERRLVGLWSEVLAIPEIGIHDDFFDLGGTSLQAAALVMRVAREFHTTVSVDTMFEAATIAEMAEVIARPDHDLPWPTLVPIQPSGSKPPFFCLPGLSGVVLSFRNLALHLGSDQPVYGLQPPGIDGKTAPLTRMEDLAAHFAQTIRLVQPNGPYMLGGYSFGGMVALEVARILRLQGEEVALLASFDGPLDISEHPRLKGKTSTQKFIQRVNRYWTRLTAFNPLENPPKILEELGDETPTQAQEDVPLLPGIKKVSSANGLLAFAYRPQPYEGRAVLFSTREVRLEQRHASFEQAWEKIVLGGIEVCDVPGDHDSILREPYVQVLAEKLKSHIEQVLVITGES